MSMTQTIVMNCDECGKQIKENAPHIEISYIERPGLPEDGATTLSGAAVMMHFHERCFNRQKALQEKRITKVASE